MHAHGLASAFAYGTVAVAANFSNKSAMLAFPFAPNTVLLVQLVAMLLTSSTLRWTGVLPFPAFSTPRFWQLLPLSLAYVVHAGLVLRSLLYLNVAVYNTLKRMTPVLVLTFKAIHERKMPAAQEVACVCMIVSGCIIAGAGDLAYSTSGYITALLCAAVQAVYILLAEANEKSRAAGKHRGALEKPLLPGMTQSVALPLLQHSTKLGTASSSSNSSMDEATGVSSALHHHAPHASVTFDADSLRVHGRTGSGNEEPVLVAANSPLANLSSSFEVLYYTASTSIPLLCLAVVMNDELVMVPHMVSALRDSGQAHWHSTAAWGAAVAWSETALAGTLVWCTECNSGLTTSIVGVLKGVVAVILGLCFMAGATQPTLLNLGGIGIVLVGGSWYSSLQCCRKPRH